MMAIPKSARDVFIVVIYFGVGFAFFNAKYGWSLSDALYFGVVTTTTVGYGDYSIVNNAPPVPCTTLVDPVDNSTSCSPSSGDSTSPTVGGVFFAITYLVMGLALIWPILSGTALSVVEKYLDVVLAKFDDTPDDGERDIGDQLCIAACLVIFCLLSGAVFMHFNEGWPFVEALYWAFVTCTTIGYGDKGFTKRSSIWFLIFYILLSVMLVIASLGIIANVQVQKAKQAKLEHLLNTPLDKEFLKSMDTGGDGEIDKGEFLEAMLIRLGKITKEDSFPIMKKFDELDADKSGFLDQDDIPLHQRPKAAAAASGGQQVAVAQGGNQAAAV
jgi:hypothetical protein